MKDIITVIKSLEDGGIILKETIRNVISLEGGFLIFLVHY